MQVGSIRESCDFVASGVTSMKPVSIISSALKVCVLFVVATRIKSASQGKATGLVRVLWAMALMASAVVGQDIPGWSGLPWGASEAAVLKMLGGKVKTHDGQTVVASVEIGGRVFGATLMLKGGGLRAVLVSATQISGDAGQLATTVMEGLVAKYGRPTTAQKHEPTGIGFYKWLRPSGSVTLTRVVAPADSMIAALKPGDAMIAILYERASDDPL